MNAKSKVNTMNSDKQYNGALLQNFQRMQDFYKLYNLKNGVLPTVSAPVFPLPLPSGIASSSMIDFPNLNVADFLDNIDLNNIPAPYFLPLDKLGKLSNIIPFNYLQNIMHHKSSGILPSEIDLRNVNTAGIQFSGLFPHFGIPNSGIAATINKLMPFPQIIGQLLGKVYPEHHVGVSNKNFDVANPFNGQFPTPALFPLGDLPKLIPIGYNDKPFMQVNTFIKEQIEKLVKDSKTSRNDDSEHTETKDKEMQDKDTVEAEQTEVDSLQPASGDIDMTNVWNINLTPDSPSKYLSPFVSSIVTPIPFFQQTRPLNFQHMNIPFPLLPMDLLKTLNNRLNSISDDINAAGEKSVADVNIEDTTKDILSGDDAMDNG